LKITQRAEVLMLTSLTLLATAAVMLGAVQPGKAAGGDPDAAEVYSYRLTMDKIQKAAPATDGINKYLAANPTVKSQMDGENDNGKTIDQQARILDTKYPQVAAIIKSNGLTTREDILVTRAFISGVIVVGMKKQEMIKDYPPNSVSPQNAAFLDQNFDKLQNLAGKMMPPQGR
jgi:hypothetical protein